MGALQKKIIFLLSICLWIFSKPTWSTVAIEEQQLVKMSHIIVEGHITSIRQSPYTGPSQSGNQPKTQLNITVKISKVVKGNRSGQSLIFSYSDSPSKGHLFKSCVGKKICKKFPKEEATFYLLDQEKDKRYSKSGAKGLRLVDEWFGIRY